MVSYRLLSVEQVADDIEEFSSELEKFASHLVLENQSLQHENKQLGSLLKEYESTLENVMSKFRGVAVRRASESGVLDETDELACFTATRLVSTFLLYHITVISPDRTLFEQTSRRYHTLATPLSTIYPPAHDITVAWRRRSGRLVGRGIIRTRQGSREPSSDQD